MLLSACALEPVGSATEPVVIPGPWVAPASTRAIAATQFVSVVDPPSVRPLGSCTSTNPFTCSCSHPACTPAHPGTNELREYLLRRFPGIRNYGTYCCRQNSNNLSYLSVHAIGRAIDLGVPTIGGDADNTVGDEVANFLVENAEYIGIQRVIWDHSFWNGERGFGALGGSPHIDHVHVELSQAGAARSTLFFTLGAPSETCTPQCNGNRLVNMDCSSIDCAATGAECLSGPPRCGTPPPPEPPEAVRVAGSSFGTLGTIGDPGRLTFAGPDRLLDTRSSTADTTWDDARRELTWNTGLPSGVTGAWVNIAFIPTAPGFLTVFPSGTTRPDTSNLNSTDAVRANLVPTPLGTGQALTVFEYARGELIADLYATMGASGDGLELVDPRRALDTRSSSMPLRAGEITPVDVGAPAGATGVLGTLAVIHPAADAHVVAFPCGVDTDASTVNVRQDELASNQFVSGLGADGTLCLRALQDVHVVVDVLGFFSPAGALEYQALTPIRLVDTRNANYFQNRLAAHQTIELPLGEAPGMPENGWAAVFNVTTLETDGDGFLSAFACERGSAPETSSHNFSRDVRATLVTTDLGTSRRACITTSTRTHLVVDLVGLWRRSDGAPPPMPMPTPNPPGEGPGEGDVDGGTSDVDAGPTAMRPPDAEGCSCRAAGGRSRGLGPLALLVALGVLVARRRRRA
ncbi:MAG: MYXO-CTERM sorting domain-containing protein [Sandaracinaceae bacterium]